MEAPNPMVGVETVARELDPGCKRHFARVEERVVQFHTGVKVALIQ